MLLGAPVSCRDSGPDASGSSGAPTTAAPTTGDETTAATGHSSGTTDSGLDTDTGSARSLVAPEAWAPTEAAEDPFADERPDPVECALGWAVETGAFEVDTELCLYGAFVQPSLAEIRAGETIELVVLHDALYASQPATAHLAIALGDRIAWETTLPIPSEPGLLRPSWTATADMAAGTAVHFHVHNHGTNNYRLIDLTVTP